MSSAQPVGSSNTRVASDARVEAMFQMLSARFVLWVLSSLLQAYYAIEMDVKGWLPVKVCCLVICLVYSQDHCVRTLSLLLIRLKIPLSRFFETPLCVRGRTAVRAPISYRKIRYHWFKEKNHQSRRRVIFSMFQVVKAAADETPLTLAVLRDHIEKELSEEAALSPEAAAKV